MHPYIFSSGFKKRAERFEAAQREKTIWRKVRAAAPVLLVIGIAMGIKAAMSIDHFSFMQPHPMNFVLSAFS